MLLKEIETRLSGISEEIETKGDALTEEQITALDSEVTALKEERTKLIAANEKRAAMLKDIAAGNIGTVVKTYTATVAPAAVVDRYDTPEYRNAFMHHVCRNAAIPVEYRADALTTTSDAGAVIPTTILQEMIRKLDSYGAIYGKVRKLNIQGGVDVPILSLKPTAQWIGETKSSDDQKIQANTNVSFSYYGLEVKIAQTLLTNVVTFDMFQREFTKLATEAIVKEMEKAIFTGNGTGKALGITVDSRVPSANVITMAPDDWGKWAGWKKKVFAKMKKAYRRGIFVMAQGTFDGYIDGMVDTTGQPIGRVNYGIDGGETYRFGGKSVETVEDDVIVGYDEAATGDVVAVFFDPSDYAINSNMQMTLVKWTDHDDNKIKNKAILICDGKLLDPNGVLIIKKGVASGG